MMVRWQVFLRYNEVVPGCVLHFTEARLSPRAPRQKSRHHSPLTSVGSRTEHGGSFAASFCRKPSRRCSVSQISSYLARVRVQVTINPRRRRSPNMTQGETYEKKIYPSN